MKTANLSEVKDGLSAYVERARNGDPVRILVRGIPAADLVPVTVAPAGAPWLEDLERRGVIRQARLPFEPLLLEPGPCVDGSPSDELVTERRAR